MLKYDKYKYVYCIDFDYHNIDYVYYNYMFIDKSKVTHK